ncbi:MULTISPECIES: sensor histidine kinase [Cyanophyceae]|jgi:signal transduction histidine kinase|uniref:sensor histidine kinase n=1 Tax=Cyanophyceae TaxID=3028117 RepID=UPI00232AAE91|nr:MULTISPECIES: HAMP domain-containing sensor histidine kinase [Cyanophyceae]MDB9355762.1 HAMP domain-containing sensor histidine kinase [Nodularia spumigena CS-587/03]MDB9341347.1 HAMP domain-containing sensor histidine kinase [Nodularia spumigena CS-589/07]MDB9399166.1 HAMP domain-containing sensor histidine kinase [Microcystis aeruginosa CS-567/02-A1]MDB9500199.1 HAMP domain-containing sensor histidine kinase [Nodularia spumigena CS-336/02]MDB9533465.1 HAMP domain-containing sensor histidi
MIWEVDTHKKTSHDHELISSNIEDFCQLQSAQLISQHPILFARIVYYDDFSKKHQEVIRYARDQVQFSPKALDFLRSESYLIDFPLVGKICEIKLNDLQAIAYLCPIGYRNQKPEYIQILTNEPISQCLQDYIKRSAMLMSNYAAIYLDYGRQKAEIKLLEHILHRVGHQLRSHLAMIGLYANNLYLGLKESPWQEQAKIIHESIQDIDTNLTEIINCGQGEKLRISPQDLRKLVLESIQSLQPLLTQKQVTISIPDISTTLLIDRLQIKQVFDNLLSNAVYFSPKSGIITCSWQIFQDEVLIKISDQGPGLSPEETQKIFTPFYSTRPGGTGLGLAIAKKIILDHYGNLWAQSVSKVGAQFCIILPRTQNI